MPTTKETWMQAAASSAQGALGIGIQRLGARYDRKQQLKTQEKMMGLQMRGEREMMDYQQKLAMQMWENTGPQGQMEQLKAAGLNPGLIYGMGGAGGQTTGPGGSPSVQGGSAPYVDTTGMGMQLGMAAAQMGLIKAQTEKTKVEADKIGGVDTQKTTGEIAKIAQETQNEIAKGQLMAIQTRIDTVKAKITEATEQEAIGIAVAELGKLQEEVMQMEVKTHIDRATRNNVIDTVKEELAGVILRNGLTKAQTTTEKGKPAIQAAELEIMAEQATDIVRKGLQRWRELELSGKQAGINEQKELREEMTTIGVPEKVVDDVINGIIMKKVLTPEQAPGKPYYQNHKYDPNFRKHKKTDVIK